MAEPNQVVFAQPTLFQSAKGRLEKVAKIASSSNTVNHGLRVYRSHVEIYASVRLGGYGADTVK